MLRLSGTAAAAQRLAALLVLAALPAAVQAAALTKGPYLQDPGPTAMTVQYETDAPADGVVRFAAGPALDRHVPAHLHEKVVLPADPKAKAAEERAFYLYRARLTDLAPGTAYRYQVALAGEAGGAVHTFRTFPERADRVTFIAYGDSRSYPDRHRAVAANFLKHDPAFILHSGDLVSRGSTYEQWGPQFFAPLADVLPRVPMMIAIGNHEGDPKNLLRLFDLPGGRTWYAFDYGPVHVVVLDNDEDKKDVLEWLDQDLAAARAPWKVVVAHYPMFNLAHHASDSNRLTFLPLYEKHGVDVVVGGHSHLYERMQPLVRTGPDGRPAGRPLTFVTSGGGGARQYAPVQHPLVAKAAKVLHYGLFTADAETLRFQALTADGQTLDAFTLTKRGGRDDPAYLAQARPMVDAMFEQGVMRLARPTVSSVPKTAQFALPLKVRFAGFADPVTVSLRLADASAGDYTVEPVTAELKRGAKEATLNVRVQGRRAVTTEPDAQDEMFEYLRPALRFVVTARSGSFERTIETADTAYKKPEPRRTPEAAPASK